MRRKTGIWLCESPRLHNSQNLLAHIDDHLTATGQASLDVWMSHGDYVTALPPGFEVIASTDKMPLMRALPICKRRFYGLQFHPEVTHTRQGQRILQHFVIDICQCTPSWTADNIIAEYIHQDSSTSGC